MTLGKWQRRWVDNLRYGNTKGFTCPIELFCDTVNIHTRNPRQLMQYGFKCSPSAFFLDIQICAIDTTKLKWYDRILIGSSKTVHQLYYKRLWSFKRIGNLINRNPSAFFNRSV